MMQDDSTLFRGVLDAFHSVKQRGQDDDRAVEFAVHEYLRMRPQDTADHARREVTLLIALSEPRAA